MNTTDDHFKTIKMRKNLYQSSFYSLGDNYRNI